MTNVRSLWMRWRDSDPGQPFAETFTYARLSFNPCTFPYGRDGLAPIG